MVRTKLRDIMSETFTNFFNNSNSFGFNVKSHEKTLQLAGQTLSNTAGGVFSPLFDFLEENDNVFTGDVTREIQRINANSFNIGMVMQQVDSSVNGPKPKFDAKF